MPKVLVTEEYLSDIASAIRSKNSGAGFLQPGDMADAISEIDTGYPEPTGTLSITANGTVNVKDYASASVQVPNTYEASDEGKVVSNGALVAQTSQTITQNGTYDTTENNEVVVNVSGGTINLQSKTTTQNGTVTPDAGYDGLSSVIVNVPSGGGSVAAFIKVTYTVGATVTATDGTTTLTAPDTTGYWVVEIPNAGAWTVTATRDGSSTSKTFTVVYTDSINTIIEFHVDAGYQEVEYLAVGSTAGPYINTGVEQKAVSYFEVDMQYTDNPGYDKWAFGTLYGAGSNEIGYYNGILFYINNSGYSLTFNTSRHVFVYAADGCYVDGNLVNTRVGVDRTGYYYDMFARGGIDGTPNNQTPNCRIYHCTIYDNDEIVRDFYPCYRKEDDEPGMFDAVNHVFYPNNGTGSFSVGPDV